jgi:histone deacetylase 11
MGNMIRIFSLLLPIILSSSNLLQASVYDFFLGTPPRQVCCALTGLGLGGYALNSWAAKTYYKNYMAPGTTNVDTPISKTAHKVPIIYSPEYNITFGGLERLHPFDAQKYGKIRAYLVNNLGLADERLYTPPMVSDNELLKVHTQEYLDSLTTSSTMAQITEIPLVAVVPNVFVQKYVLKPMRYATGGTVLGARLALEHGWAINLGGGYHHAKDNEGGGFCVYADAPLALATLREQHTQLKAMIIDLDAHQGNGNSIALKDQILDEQGEFKRDASVALFDIYNKDVWPAGDADFVIGICDLFLRVESEAIKPVKYNYPVATGTADAEYLSILQQNLPQALDEFAPDFIIYNAGTDILAGDEVGRLQVSAQGIIERDEFVFAQARKRGIPILMILSGGYTQQSAGVISESIANLKAQGLIEW